MTCKMFVLFGYNVSKFHQQGQNIKKEFIFIVSTFFIFYLCFATFMPQALGFLGIFGELNHFLFGDFGLFYPFVLLPLNFIFYKRAYNLDNVQKSECVGLFIAFIATALLFAILGTESGYIPEVLYTIVGFVFGRLGAGFLSLIALLLSIILVFPRFVEIVFGIKVNLTLFALLEEKIRQALYGFFGGKEEQEEIKPSFTPQEPKQQEIQKEIILKPKPEKKTPDQIAAQLADEFIQNEEKVETPKQEVQLSDNTEVLLEEYKSKKLQNFMTKASAEFDEYFDKHNKASSKEAFVPEIFLKPKKIQDMDINLTQDSNFEEPSYKRKNIDIDKEEKSFQEQENDKVQDKFTFEVRELEENDESDENTTFNKEEIKQDENISSFEEKYISNVAKPKELQTNVNLLNSLEKGKMEPPKDFKLPPLDFLVRPSNNHLEINEQEIDKKIYDLLEKLRRFKIGGDVISTYTGPVVTTFEFRPSADVKVSRILSLQDDLAMALRATSIRIQAPVPGKDVVGIEVPNEQIQTIYLREILESEVFKTAKSPLTIALGKDIVGNAFITDLKKLPHLLIAGTTGSGKSVGINAMLLSLLYRNSPQNLRLMMIDPKMLEFSIYNDIPHLLTPVITDPKKAIVALSNMVAEMERRYKLMAEARTKNIENFNDKCAELGLSPLPFIVVIIDELADLMMTAGKDVEFYIGRLAQMARASGIHLIVATQRPSVDVVTGLIKANLPSRLAYKVGQRVDSKVILDAQGAESLLGRGDSLFTPPGTSNLVRLHAPFASEMEIDKIVEFLKAQQTVEYDENFLKDSSNASNAGNFGGENLDGEGLDELIEQAKAVILEDKKTSISYLQRRLKIGYNRAANIIEQLAQMGVLSEPDAKGQREIL